MLLTDDLTANTDETSDLTRESSNPTVILNNREIPLYAIDDSGRQVWALGNLIFSIAGIILLLVMGIRLLMLKRVKCECTEQKEQPEQHLIFIVMILATVATMAFILTQDTRSLMVMADLWTVVHLLLFKTALVSYMFAFKKTTYKRQEYEFEITETLPIIVEA